MLTKLIPKLLLELLSCLDKVLCELPMGSQDSQKEDLDVAVTVTVAVTVALALVLAVSVALALSLAVSSGTLSSAHVSWAPFGSCHSPDKELLPAHASWPFYLWLSSHCWPPQLLCCCVRARGQWHRAEESEQSLLCCSPCSPVHDAFPVRLPRLPLRLPLQCDRAEPPAAGSAPHPLFLWLPRCQ